MTGEQRVALVIGNGGYKHAPYLMNPKRDARAISAILKKLDFEVVEGFDLDLYNTADVQDQFEQRLKGADVSLLFYAGHGLQVEGKNYLVPVDAEISTLTHLNYRTVAFDILLTAMNRHTPASLVFLDACRDNPFTRSLIRSLTGPTRDMMAIRGGLAEMEKVEGTFIAYATAPNTVAYDGTGTNSPFTTALLEHIETPGLSVSDMMIDVRNKVMDMTSRKQVPWEQSSLNSKFYFVEKEDIVTDPAQDHATAAWKLIEDTVLSNFIATYPNAPQRISAEARLEELRKVDEKRREREEERRRKEQQAAEDKPERPFKPPTRFAWRLLGIGGAVVLGLGLSLVLNLPPQTAKPVHPPVKPPKGSVTFTIVLPGQKRTVSIVPGSKETFQDAAFAPKLVVVPKGRYKRGSENGASDETPVETVTISEPFAVGQFEVTRGQFTLFVKETGYKVGNGCYTYENSKWEKRSNRNYLKPGFNQDDSHPVVCVNWHDTQAYIKWLNKKLSGSEKGPYRLLSETQWEYVARAETEIRTGAEQKYSFGNSEADLCQYANGADQSSPFSWKNKLCNDGVGIGTAKIGSYKANKFGLYDIHGNVWEWVQDHYHNSYKGSPTDGSAWEKKGDSSSSSRVLRGGSWLHIPRSLRSTDRFENLPTFRSNNVGFRISRTLTP